jgi:cytidylate kinase
MVPIDLITLSREYGAGASMLAAALGERLGWRVLDEEIPLEIARRLGLPDDALVETDEHAATLLERVGQALVMGSPDLLVNPAVIRLPDPADVAAVTRQLLFEAAADPPLIIVGHGSQALFQHREGTLRLRLVAPLEHRMRLICARRDCDGHDAVRFARRIDADRAHYVREYFHCDVRDPLLYHLQINTGAVGFAESIDTIVRLVEGRRTEPSASSSSLAEAPASAEQD